MFRSWMCLFVVTISFFPESRTLFQEMQPPLRKIQEREHRKCPYLDTVDRKVLDFDLEKVGSLLCSFESRNAPFRCHTRMSTYVSSAESICK